ncbi:hypothetical protein STEG23_010803 [Scotinomys teguina]
MSAVMLLPGTNGSLLLVQRTVTRTIVLQETIGKELHCFNPSNDACKGDDLLLIGIEDYIHITIQQRNGRKTMTTIQGIAGDYGKKILMKMFKKKLGYNITVIEYPEYGDVAIG